MINKIDTSVRARRELSKEQRKMAAAIISQSVINHNINNNSNIHNRFGYSTSSSSSLLSYSAFLVRKHQPSSLTCCSKCRRQSSVVISAFNSSSPHSHDVVVIGAGIIGLTIAHQLLLHSDLSVAVVDASVPCAGATGAGTNTTRGTRF